MSDVSKSCLFMHFVLKNAINVVHTTHPTDNKHKILVRYSSELSLKGSKAKQKLGDILKNNICRRAKKYDPCIIVTKRFNYLEVQTSCPEDMIPLLKRIFGIGSISQVLAEVTGSIEDIINLSIKTLGFEANTGFDGCTSANNANIATHGNFCITRGAFIWLNPNSSRLLTSSFSNSCTFVAYCDKASTSNTCTNNSCALKTCPIRGAIH